MIWTTKYLIPDVFITIISAKEVQKMIIFASDFDSTLHFTDEEGNGYFKEEDIAAINAFRKEGNVFGLCTGRPLYGLQDDMKGAPEMDFIIASTGGVIAGIESDGYNVLWDKRISCDDVKTIYAQCEEKGYQVYVHADGNVFVFDHQRPHYPGQKVLREVDDLKDAHITGISIWTPDEENASGYTAYLNETMNTIQAYQNRNWMDIVAPGVSKGNGAFRARDIFKADTVATIGDSYNDIPMLVDGDISFTFHSSPDVVKEAADYCVDSVAEAIEKLKELVK